MAATNDAISLRHSLTAYRSRIVILSAVTALSLYAVAISGDWKWLLAASGICVLSGLEAFFFGLKYNVFWDDSGITMSAAGISGRRILFDEISAISYEVGRSESPKQTRPFNRVVIHSRPQAQNAFIDVSLRHFRLEDIQTLLDAVHERRPEVQIPEVPYIRSQPTANREY